MQGLRSGCCPDPEPGTDGLPGRHLIRSRHYKTVTDDDGNHVSAGEVREVPWVAIAPVVRTIRVLEQMVPEGKLLLSSAHHDFPWFHGFHGALKNSSLNRRIREFVTWANHEADETGRASRPRAAAAAQRWPSRNFRTSAVVIGPVPCATASPSFSRT